MDRRHFLSGLLAAPLPLWAADAAPIAHPAVGQPLAPWTPGTLDIHHIATGRGNATLVVMPDGTSLLIDAGASADAPETSTPPRPSAQRRPGEWVGRYVQRHLRATGRSALDYLLVTHLHPDHLGDVTNDSPRSTQGDYRLTGVMDVAELLPVGTLLDRAFPGYDDPMVIKARFADNYLAFVRARQKQGLAVQRFVAGRGTQIAPKGHVALPAGTPAFGVRNLAVNGEVWTGEGEQARAMFPPLYSLATKDYPNENMCSTAVRIASGRFGYFTAGDLTSYSFDGDQPWRDVLTAAARVCGPVDVATADHHGMFDGLSAPAVRVLRPQAWLIQAWHISHPDMLQMERMLSERLYHGARDIFSTGLTRENYLANRRLVSRMRSTEGHVVVRVAPGGASFQVLVTDNADEQDRVKLATGPYASGRNAG